VSSRRRAIPVGRQARRSIGRAGGGRPPQPVRPGGFTLIEMMMVIAMLSILISLALPAYNSTIVRMHRTAAERFMLDVANREEQYMLDARSYTATIGSGGLGIAPEADIAARYTFAVTLTGNDCNAAALAGPSFVIAATAIGAQARDGNLCLDSRNNRIPVGKWER
jgi:type IV pilus assembly protein PilE